MCILTTRAQRARQAGLFNNVKGRGQPLASHTQDKNPFIGREEFLMNRIVQRQGAAPPWVEVQGGQGVLLKYQAPFVEQIHRIGICHQLVQRCHQAIVDKTCDTDAHHLSACRIAT